MTSIIGIDLASQPANTAVCRIELGTAGAGVVTDLGKGVKDRQLIEMITSPDVLKVAIDAPFGWPLAFIDTVAGYRDRLDWLSLSADELRFRATDLAVKEVMHKRPLSTVTDALSWPTMRCARLLGHLSAAGHEIDRRGTGLLMEVYPAAALHVWGHSPARWENDPGSYKGAGEKSRLRRERLMAELREELNDGVSWDDAHHGDCVANDDNLDALVCALMGLAALEGATIPIPATLQWAALREGWIHLPVEKSLASLGQQAAVTA